MKKQDFRSVGEYMGLAYTIVIHGDEDVGYFIDEVYIPGLPIARDNETRWSSAPLAFGAGQEIACKLIDDARRER
ncbi:hypothetical protein [Luteimonas aquatica]|uniref:hypothetical protein n=1 Tax=Luteimonas aquatica TaxID=450364 RepID=UPI001F589A23|nr:hypothetical protein [Luteimonas aquatica]